MTYTPPVHSVRTLVTCRGEFASGDAQTPRNIVSYIEIAGVFRLSSSVSWKIGGTFMTKKIAVVAVLCAVVALVACRREEYRPLKLGGAHRMGPSSRGPFLFVLQLRLRHPISLRVFLLAFARHFFVLGVALPNRGHF